MARKYITTDIIDPVKAPFSKRSLTHLNTAFDDLTAQIVESSFSVPYTTNDVIILSGCEVTANIPGTSEVTAGQIYYNGRIYDVDVNASISTPSNTLVWDIVETFISGDPATFSDGNTYNFHSIEKFVLSNAVSGTGIADYDDSTIKYKIKTERFDIGTWDMDSANTTQFVIKLDRYSEFKNKVLNTVVSIFSDLGILQSPYSSTGVDCYYEDIVNIGSNDLGLRLSRITGGKFDNTSYNDAVINRGYVYVTWGDI